MQAVRVQRPKDEFAEVGVCPRTKRPIRLCYNEFSGAPAADGGPLPLPPGIPRESDAAPTATAEDIATGAAPSILPVILLIMGVASPGQFWDDRFCSTLAQAGPYRVIRFDNRDVGLSTHLDDGEYSPEEVDKHMSAPSSADAVAVPPGRGHSTGHNAAATAAGDASSLSPSSSSSSSSATSSSSAVSSFFSNVFGRGGRGGQARSAAAHETTEAASADADASQKSKNAPDYLRFAMAAMNPGKRIIPETYTVDDMAGDALGLMDALNVRTAHVVGMCLGGMIAQCMALRAPERVVSLTLFATHTSDAHGVRWPSMLTMLSMIRCAPRGSIYAKYKPLIAAATSPAEAQRLEHERDAARARMYAEALTKLIAMLAGDKEKIGFDQERTLHQMERAFRRSLYVMGSGRQVVATLNAAPRGEALRQTITSVSGSPAATTAAAAAGAAKPRYVPTIILQGTKDSICPADNAKELAECIPGSRLIMLEGCGHIIAPLYRQRILQSVQAAVTEGERAKRAAVGDTTAAPVVRSHL